MQIPYPMNYTLPDIPFFKSTFFRQFDTVRSKLQAPLEITEIHLVSGERVIVEGRDYSHFPIIDTNYTHTSHVYIYIYVKSCKTFSFLKQARRWKTRSDPKNVTGLQNEVGTPRQLRYVPNKVRGSIFT